MQPANPHPSALSITLTVALLVNTSTIVDARDSDRTGLSPLQPYSGTRVNPVSHEVDFSVVVTPPYHAKVFKVWLPLPQTNAAQQITESRLSTFPENVKPKIGREGVYGNKFAYFEFHQPKGGQIIRHRFRATVWEMRWDVDPGRVTAGAGWPKSFQPYLRPQASLAKDDRFQKTLREIVPHSQGSGQDLTKVMDWIDRELTYDHANASLRADAEHAFTLRRGHCSDYHGLCTAMARSLGYPTRLTYGLAMFPKNSPSHCKVEAFLPPYGWVSFDLSETQKMVRRINADTNLDSRRKKLLAQAARTRLQSGFRDNTWLLVTKGTGYELAPPASEPVRVVRTIYAEADGRPLPDPDPANLDKREFAWMTVHKFTPDKPVSYPFEDTTSLEGFLGPMDGDSTEYDAVYGQDTRDHSPVR